MKNIKIEFKWAIIFTIMTLLWMVLEKLCGLHGKYIDYHLYLTNLFAIPAIWVMVLALKNKKNNYYSGNMNYKQGLTTAEAEAVFNYKSYAINSSIFAMVFGVATTAIAMIFLKTKYK